MSDFFVANGGSTLLTEVPEMFGAEQVLMHRAKDEETFNKADMADVKNLFTGSVSFGKNVQTKMYQIYAPANDSLKAMDSLYSSNGTKSLSTGNMFDTLF